MTNKTHVYLNEKGVELYGDIFPSGRVPIMGHVAHHASLAGLEGNHLVFMADWKNFTYNQKYAIAKKILRESYTNEEADKLIAAINLQGFIPFREEFTTGAPAIDMRYLI